MATAAHFFQSVFFDEAYYLAAKTAALNANGSGLRWTVESTLEAIKANNMTPWQHFCDFGCKEYSADGTLGIDLYVSM